MKAFHALTGKTRLIGTPSFMDTWRKMKRKRWLKSPGDTEVQFEQKPLIFFFFIAENRSEVCCCFFISYFCVLFVKMDH